MKAPAGGSSKNNPTPIANVLTPPIRRTPPANVPTTTLVQFIGGSWMKGGGVPVETGGIYVGVVVWVGEGVGEGIGVGDGVSVDNGTGDGVGEGMGDCAGFGVGLGFGCGEGSGGGWGVGLGGGGAVIQFPTESKSSQTRCPVGSTYHSGLFRT